MSKAGGTGYGEDIKKVNNKLFKAKFSIITEGDMK